MGKLKKLRNSWFLTINKVQKAWSKPVYQVVVKDSDRDADLDMIEFTEEAWSDLELYFRSQRSGIIWRPFTEEEMEKAWKPRFSGMNPKYIEFARMAWNSAFEYVNEQIYKNLEQKEE